MQEIRLVLADDHAVVRSGTRELLEQQDDLRIIGEASDGIERPSGPSQTRGRIPRVSVRGSAAGHRLPNPR